MSLEKIIIKNERKKVMEDNKYTGVLFTTDHHYPYESKEMKKIELQILKEESPSYHVLGGDWIDASGLSSFTPNAEYIRKTQDEIDGFVYRLAEMHEASPDTKRIMLFGNHDLARLERAKAETPFGLAGLRLLNFKNLFYEAAQAYGLEIGEIDFVKEWMLGPGLKFIHGDPRMDKKLKGGVTGIRRTVSEYPGEFHLMMGHGHRKQYGRHPFKEREVHMVAGMLDVNQVSYETFSDYENGLAWINYSPNSRPKPIYDIQSQRLLPNGELILNGKVFSGR
jgi:hypothetical protein